MDRKDFYYKQAVQEDELDEAFDNVEQAFWNQLVDHGWYGIAPNYHGSGTLDISENTSNDLQMICQAGRAYTAQGKRIYRSSNVDLIDCSQDKDGNPTVPSAGKERYISIFIVPYKEGSDPRTDGHGDTVNFVQTESHAFEVINGEEAAPGGADRPDLRDDAILLGDVLLGDSTSAITGEGLDPINPGEFSKTRKEDWDEVSYGYSGRYIIASDHLEVNRNIFGGSPGIKIYGESFIRAWGSGCGGTDPVDPVKSFNIVATYRGAVGIYEIELPNTLFDHATDYCVIATINSTTAGAYSPKVDKINEATFEIRIEDNAGVPTDVEFDFIVVGRPIIP